MFKLNEIQSLFICPICKTTFQDPVTLTCGKTVCKQHCEEIIKDDCQFCNEKHSIPKNGFIVNEIINTQLELHVDKINMSFPQYEDYKKTLEDLNKGLKEVETSMNNQESYLSDYFGEITRQVDLRRETVIEDIHDYSNKIIQNINNIKEECLEKSKTSLKIKENIQTFKDKLKILNDMFNSLDMDDNKFKELLTQKQLDEAQRLIQPLLNDCKLECHKKFYKLETNDIQLNKFFGSIIGYDFDHEKIKKIDSEILSTSQTRRLLDLTGFGSKSFSLLYRGSKHGFKHSDFHNMCDGKPNTLALIKSTTGYIFGGYTCVPWSSPGSGEYKRDSTAFLFTLTNPSYTPLKLNVTNSTCVAVYHYFGHGICFGYSDMVVSDSSNTNAGSTIDLKCYQYPEGKSGEEGGKFFLGDKNKFKSAEIEVFKVI